MGRLEQLGSHRLDAGEVEVQHRRAAVQLGCGGEEPCCIERDHVSEPAQELPPVNQRPDVRGPACAVCANQRALAVQRRVAVFGVRAARAGQLELNVDQLGALGVGRGDRTGIGGARGIFARCVDDGSH
jgi:hypothetical protein